MVFNAEPLGMSLCIMALILFAINQHNLLKKRYEQITIDDASDYVFMLVCGAIIGLMGVLVILIDKA